MELELERMPNSKRISLGSKVTVTVTFQDNHGVDGSIPSVGIDPSCKKIKGTNFMIF